MGGLTISSINSLKYSNPKPRILIQNQLMINMIIVHALIISNSYGHIKEGRGKKMLPISC